MENNKAEKLDFLKQYKDLYAPGKTPVVVDVPSINMMMVDGTGAPEGEQYQHAVSVLYSIAYSIKMSKMSGQQPEGYLEYTMPPLEGLWNDDPLDARITRKEWTWTSMLRQPDFVTPEVFAWGIERAKAKETKLDFSVVRLEAYTEGLCVQAMHHGPYSTEPETIARMKEFMEQNGLQPDYSATRRHHDLYIKNPQRTKPENLRTVLRLPVKPL